MEVKESIVSQDDLHRGRHEMERTMPQQCHHTSSFQLVYATLAHFGNWGSQAFEDESDSTE